MAIMEVEVGDAHWLRLLKSVKEQMDKTSFVSSIRMNHEQYL